MTSPNSDKPHFDHPQSQSISPFVNGNLPVQTAQDGSIQQQIQQLMNRRVNLNTDIVGLFETVSATPTLIPTSPYEQIKIYLNGGTAKIYWHDGTAWRSAGDTASGASGAFTYVKTVDFVGSSVTTGTITVTNGLITSIS